MGTLPNTEPNRPRRWKSLILIPSLMGLLGGYLVSHAFSPKYTSTAVVFVENQKVPDSIVPSLITADFAEQIASMQSHALAANRLRSMLERLGYKAEEQGKLVEVIRDSVSVDPLVTDMTGAATSAASGGSDAVAGQEKKSSAPQVPAFTVNFTYSNPQQAQQICTELTSLLLAGNLQSRIDSVKGTTDFLQRQADDSRNSLLRKGVQLSEYSKKGAPHDAAYEAEQKVLALEYDTAQRDYIDLIAKLSQAEMAQSMENQQLGEQMALAQPASLPDDPSFPNRLDFAGGGLAGGLILGIVLALRRRFRRADSGSEELSAVEPKPSVPRRAFFGHS